MDVNFNVSSNPNGLNPCGDASLDFGILGNHSGTMQMNHTLLPRDRVNRVFSNHARHDSSLIGSVLISSNHNSYDFDNHRNYGNFSTRVKQEPDMVTSIFPSTSPPRSCYASSSSPFSLRLPQNQMISSPSAFVHQLDLSQRVAQQRRRHILSLPSPRVHVEGLIDYFPVQNNPHLTCVSITETVTKQYVTNIPTNSMVSVQNDIERVKRALACESNIWNSPPNHASFSHNFFGEQSIDHDHANLGEVLNPNPLNIIFPYDSDQSPYPWYQMGNLDNFSSQVYLNPVLQESFLNHYDNQNLCQDGKLQDHNLVKRTRKPKRSVENIMGYLFNETDEEKDSDEEDGYDGRTHSLPYEKYGPYTCPKCNNVFDTSQKFAAHMVSTHYKNETTEEKKKRLRARYRKRFRLLNPDALGVKIDSLEQQGAKPKFQMIVSEIEREKDRVKAKNEEKQASILKEGCGTSNSVGDEGYGDSSLIDVVVKQESI